MKLLFLGTRAYVEASSRRHRRHSSLLISHENTRLKIDSGADWLGRVGEGDPDAIVLTHAHPDHAAGLEEGSPCPVYADERTWAIIDDYPIDDRHTLAHKRERSIGDLRIKAFPVQHSIRCPAVGLRISTGDATIFYCPDVVAIPDRHAALAGLDLYVGDGSTITSSLVRPAGDTLVGHTTIRAQLGWCREEGVPKALFTHCGTEIIDGDERTLGPEVASLGEERGVEAGLAYDGMAVELS